MARKRKKKKIEVTQEEEQLRDAETPQEETQPSAESADSAEGDAESPEVLPELPADDNIPVEEKLELVQAALEASESKAAEYLDGWQRAQAEFTNYRKRQERERELMRFESVGRIIKRYLPIVDDLERALQNRPTEGEGAAWADGIELIYRKLMGILEAEGVTQIEAEGQEFDPNLHEAVMQTESDEHESGMIIEVLQNGYMLGDRVLRPAMVLVAA